MDKAESSRLRLTDGSTPDPAEAADSCQDRVFWTWCPRCWRWSGPASPPLAGCWGSPPPRSRCTRSSAAGSVVFDASVVSVIVECRKTENLPDLWSPCRKLHLHKIFPCLKCAKWKMWKFSPTKGFSENSIESRLFKCVFNIWNEKRYDCWVSLVTIFIGPSLWFYGKQSDFGKIQAKFYDFFAYL